MNENKLGPWKLIKSGFWLGIGFAIPMIIVDLVSIGSIWGVGSMVWESEFDEDGLLDYSLDDIDTTQLTIKNQKETMNGEQLLIHGELLNDSDTTVNSVEIEAELFDAQGQFVYECSEHLSKSIASGATENIQIKCGCSKNGVPEYNSVKLQIISASSY